MSPDELLISQLAEPLLRQFPGVAGLREYFSRVDPDFDKAECSQYDWPERVAREGMLFLSRRRMLGEVLGFLSFELPNRWHLIVRRDDYGAGAVRYVRNDGDRRLEGLKIWTARDVGHLEHLERHAATLTAKLKNLDHDHLPRIYGHELIYGRYVVMHMQFFADEPSLWDWQSRQGATEVLEAYIGAGEGLFALHERGLEHRNFKPFNVFVRGQGHACVAGFGMQRDGEPCIGNPYYASPEQCDGQPLTDKSDQYSFCVALYQALFRVHPRYVPEKSSCMQDIGEDPAFPKHAENPELVRDIKNATLMKPLRPLPGLSAPLDRIREILERGLDRSPANRHASMRELLDRLGAELVLLRGASARSSALQRMTRRRTRWTGGSIILGLSVLLVWGIVRMSRGPQETAPHTAEEAPSVVAAPEGDSLPEILDHARRSIARQLQSDPAALRGLGSTYQSVGACSGRPGYCEGAREIRKALIRRWTEVPGADAGVELIGLHLELAETYLCLGRNSEAWIEIENAKNGIAEDPSPSKGLIEQAGRLHQALRRPEQVADPAESVPRFRFKSEGDRCVVEISSNNSYGARK